MAPNRVQTLRSSVKGQRPVQGTREAGELYVNFPDRQIGVINTGKTAEDFVAVRYFAQTSDYVSGSYAWNGGTLYKATTNVSAGAFNVSQWTKVVDEASLHGMILTIDGAGSGLDADLLDGQQGAFYAADSDLETAENRITATETKNTQQDGRLTSVEGVNTTQNGRLDAVEAKNTAQDGSISSIISTNTTQDTRLDAVETKNSQQDTALAGKLSDAPSDNQTYGRKNAAWVDVAEEAPSDGISYGRKNGTWAASVGGATIADAAPGLPLLPGQLWFESDTGNTYIWYQDANSSQWVQIAGELPDASYPVRTAQSFNRVVNGAMQISQENGNTAGTTNGYYAVDQWKLVFGTTGAVSCQRVQVYTPNGSNNRLRVTVTTADTSIAAGEVLLLEQSIEGLRLVDFMYGAAAAKQSVLRFGFKGPAGTYAISLTNIGGNRSYVQTFTIAAGQANTDTVQTFVIPGDTTGAWAADTSVGIILRVTLMCGTNFHGATGWSATGAIGTATMSNFMATNGNVMELYDVGLHLDPNNTGQAPEWTTPDYAEEEALCKRYWNKIQYGGIYLGLVTAVSNIMLGVNFPTMRTTPAAGGIQANPVYNNVGTPITPTAFTAPALSPDSVRLTTNHSAAITGIIAGPMSLNARM